MTIPTQMCLGTSFPKPMCLGNNHSQTNVSGKLRRHFPGIPLERHFPNTLVWEFRITKHFCLGNGVPTEFPDQCVLEMTIPKQMCLGMPFGNGTPFPRHICPGMPLGCIIRPSQDFPGKPLGRHNRACLGTLSRERRNVPNRTLDVNCFLFNFPGKRT